MRLCLLVVCLFIKSVLRKLTLDIRLTRGNLFHFSLLVSVSIFGNTMNNAKKTQKKLTGLIA